MKPSAPVSSIRFMATCPSRRSFEHCLDQLLVLLQSPRPRQMALVIMRGLLTEPREALGLLDPGTDDPRESRRIPVADARSPAGLDQQLIDIARWPHVHRGQAARHVADQLTRDDQTVKPFSECDQREVCKSKAVWQHRRRNEWTKLH